MEDNKEPVIPTEPKDNKDAPLQPKPERTEEDKVAFNLKKKADEAKALGLDPHKILGDQDEVPEWYRKEKAKEAKETALQMAEKIPEEDKRERVKEILGRLAPSADPEADFRTALGAVSAEKNKEILSEINGYSRPRVIAPGSSQPPKEEDEFVPTAEEARMMQPPYNLTKDKILAARKKA